MPVLILNMKFGELLNDLGNNKFLVSYVIKPSSERERKGKNMALRCGKGSIRRFVNSMYTHQYNQDYAPITVTFNETLSKRKIQAKVKKTLFTRRVYLEVIFVGRTIWFKGTAESIILLFYPIDYNGEQAIRSLESK